MTDTTGNDALPLNDAILSLSDLRFYSFQTFDDSERVTALEDVAAADKNIDTGSDKTGSRLRIDTTIHLYEGIAA